MKSLGQLAYEAYGITLGDEIRKELIPGYSARCADFSSLSPEIQAAWEASADAITAALLKKPAEFAQ